MPFKECVCVYEYPFFLQLSIIIWNVCLCLFRTKYFDIKTALTPRTPNNPIIYLFSRWNQFINCLFYTLNIIPVYFGFGNDSVYSIYPYMSKPKSCYARNMLPLVLYASYTIINTTKFQIKQNVYCEAISEHTHTCTKIIKIKNRNTTGIMWNIQIFTVNDVLTLNRTNAKLMCLTNGWINVEWCEHQQCQPLRVRWYVYSEVEWNRKNSRWTVHRHPYKMINYTRLWYYDMTALQRKKINPRSCCCCSWWWCLFLLFVQLFFFPIVVLMFFPFASGS